MRKDLARSGIPLEEALRRGWFPVTQTEAETLLGFKLPDDAGGGYAISFFDPATGNPSGKATGMSGYG